MENLSFEHYFVEKPRSKLKLYKLECVLRNKKFTFLTSSGVFSPRRIDKGTRILVENMILPTSGKILDLGCGYGVIGIVAAKLCRNCEVYLTDINERALWLARRNIKINKVRNAKVIKSDGFSSLKGMKFDCIITNPPISAGLKLCYRLIEESKDFLRPSGILEIVARPKKGGKRLMERMLEVFGNCTTIAKKSGYRVYLSKKRKK